MESGIDRFVAGMPWLELLVLRYKEIEMVAKIKELRGQQ